MPIDGIRISAFFTTHLMTDQPSVCNTLTNIAFAPIQQLIGQKNYQCLQGRIHELPSNPQLPSAQLNSAWKVIVIIAAIFFTPCGILTRCLSFYSSDVNLGCWIALLLPISAIERSKFFMSVDSGSQIKIQAQLAALEKQKALDKHLSSAITFLLDLEHLLYTSNLPEVKKWLDAASKEPSYPYPFQIIEKLKANSLQNIPSSDLLRQLENLLWSCNYKLGSTPSTTATERQSKFEAELDAILKQNNQFFSNILNDMEDFALSTKDVANRLIEKKNSADYSYVFYTEPLVLKALKQITPHNRDLEACEAVYNDCIKIIQKNALLSPLIKEDPSPHLPTIATLKLTIAQLDNIGRIQALYNSLKSN